MAAIFPILLLLAIFRQLQNFTWPVRIKYLAFIVLKLITSLAITFYYFSIYKSGDTLLHFQQMEILASVNYSEIFDALVNNNWPQGMAHQNQRSLIFSLMLLPLYFLCYGNFWALTFSLILLSCIFLISLANHVWRIDARLACVMEPFIFLLPGVLIWTGGIFKETIAYMALLCCSWMVYIFLKYGRFNILYLLIGLVGFLFLFLIRYFIAAAFVLSIVLFLLYFFLATKNYFKAMAMALALTATAILIFSHPVLNPLELPIYIDMSYQNFIANETFSYKFEYAPSNWKAILIDTPQAVVQSIFGPLPIEWLVPQRGLYAIEIYLLIWLIIYFRKGQKWSISTIYFAFCILFVFVFFGISNPNFGTLFRYKAILFPLLYGVILKQNSLFNEKIISVYNKLQIANQTLKS